MQKTWLKLSAIQQFTIIKFIKKQWQCWDDTNKKYLRSETYLQGYKPQYIFEAKEGMLSLSQAQTASMLVSCFDGTSKPTGHTFSVKTNGETGMKIRYFINEVIDFSHKTQDNTSANFTHYDAHYSSEPPLEEYQSY